ncbi:SixA phosphatase family protein [Rhodovibrio salinarum]|uniref:Histidine phosphatase family protein n=1 Tax=Rhodovibrio salinarum TaxID=1087 RepID=A0A934QIB9_9PROT|nr:histidine phosphatase family protein [Rhodovibrio salinarum]MBK1697521.1 histidine phosphatase family protein [Rhodovibrio salinarum]
MKTLYLLRHAKSSWDDPSLADHDRPLAPRGRKAAPRMAVWLRTQAIRPDLVICSSAARARETWELVADELQPAPEVDVRRAVYDAGPEQLIAVVRGAPAQIDTLMLVGHNPAMEEAAALLAGDGDLQALATLQSKYPTAAIAELTFNVDTWDKVGRDTGYLSRFVRPKDLAG